MPAARRRMPNPRLPYLRIPGWETRRLKTIAVYAAATFAGVSLFIFLHYIGNRIPYGLAQQRIANELAVNQGEYDRRYFGGERPLFDFEFCQMAVTVITGAHRDASDRPLLDAIALLIFQQEITPGGNYCAELAAASGGAEFDQTSIKYRYWWGSKATLANLLRFLPVYDIHRLILFVTYGAWALLAAALLLMGRRVLLAASPLIALGAAFSGVGYFADIANGIPYLWTLLAASVLALLLWRPGWARRAPLFCYITGMVSAYLWLFDGHTALAMVLIGLVAWLGYRRLKESAPIRRAAACLALYLAGFAICVALGQGVKVAVVEWATEYPGWDVAMDFFQTVSLHIDRTGAETAAGITGGDAAAVRACEGCGNAGWQRLPIIRDLRGFGLLTSLGIPAGNLLGAYSALALAGAAAAAVWQARRGRRELGRSLLWLGALALLAAGHFFLPSDVPFHNARFAFLLLAMCWTALLLAAPHPGRRWMLAPAAATAAFCLAPAAAIAAYWHIDTARVMGQGDAGNLPVLRAAFDVYRDDGRLVYVNDDCSRVDPRRRFFAHITPKYAIDLPHDRQAHGFDNLTFKFGELQRPVWGKCVAVAGLPDYDIASIRTGQYIPGQGQIWSGQLNLLPESLRAEYAAITAGAPLFRGVFDLYHNGSELAYVKESCRMADTETRFFLHVVPEYVADLPLAGRERGFENLNFDFNQRGLLFDGKCIATVKLPDYGIAEIETGQYIPGQGQIWGGRIDLLLESLRVKYAAITAGTPLSRGVFDLYHIDGELAYIKESCQAADTEARFFLHVIPEYIDDLPPAGRERGFDNLNFDFTRRGRLFEGNCIAAVRLPDYGIAGIETGQFIPGQGQIWSGRIDLLLESLRAKYPEITTGTPLARGVFDLYRNGNDLAYVKESCQPADTEARFFLHVIPEDVADLPLAGREHGFDNLNFDFGQRGRRFGGRCMATVQLPDYGIASIETGQFAPGKGRIWEAETPWTPPMGENEG